MCRSGRALGRGFGARSHAEVTLQQRHEQWLDVHEARGWADSKCRASREKEAWHLGNWLEEWVQEIAGHLQLVGMARGCGFYFWCDISHSVLFNSLQRHGLQPARFLCPWSSPGKNTGVGFHFLLQGIFLTQGSNSGLLQGRQIAYHLCHQGSDEKMLKV